MNKIILFFALAISLLSCNVREQGDIQKDVLASESDFRIAASDLVSEFAKDSAASHEKYVGKILTVEGKIAVLELLDTINLNSIDTLPWLMKFILKRVESDINTSNVFFEAPSVDSNKVPYLLIATFPKEYRDKMMTLKKNDKIQVKGKLEYISTVSSKTEGKITSRFYHLSLQGCVLEEEPKETTK